MGADPCTTPSAPCSKYASTTSGDYRRERREYPILTWHTQNETTASGSVTKKNHLCSTKFTTIIFQWHLGMHIRPITHVIIKCRQTDKTQQNKKIGHQIHRKHYITPNNLSLDLADWWNRNNHKKDTSSRGVTTFFAKSVTIIDMNMTKHIRFQLQCIFWIQIHVLAAKNTWLPWGHFQNVGHWKWRKTKMMIFSNSAYICHGFAIFPSKCMFLMVI